MQLLAFGAIFISALFVMDDAQDITRCSGSSDAGLPCNAHIGPPVQKFYFDARTRVCQPFIYNGCYGNSNRFDTAAMCRTSCVERATNATDTCPGGADPYMVVKGVPARCTTVRDCLSGYGCSKGVCCPNKADICQLKYESGKAGADGKNTHRYYYNTEFKACMVFEYFGYEGNANSFVTYNDCVEFCS